MSYLLWYMWNAGGGVTPVINGNGVLTIRLRQIGSTTEVTFTFLNNNGLPFDPRQPNIEVTFPDESVVNAVPERMSKGVYFYKITTPQTGNYYYTFSAI